MNPGHVLLMFSLIVPLAGCAKSEEASISDADAATALDGEAGLTAFEGEIMVVQQNSASGPTAGVYESFGLVTGPRAVEQGLPPPNPNCEVIRDANGCDVEQCNGSWWGPIVGDEGGWGPVGAYLLSNDDPKGQTQTELTAGALQVQAGGQLVSLPQVPQSFDPEAPPLPQPFPVATAWRPGDVVEASAPGARVPGFQVELPFPSPLDLSVGGLDGDVLASEAQVTITWAPPNGPTAPDMVEATAAAAFVPIDFLGANISVIRCVAPATAGILNMTLPKLYTPTGTWQQLIVRASSSATSTRTTGRVSTSVRLTVASVEKIFTGGNALIAPDGGTTDAALAGPDDGGGD